MLYLKKKEKKIPTMAQWDAFFGKSLELHAQA